jgi:hypothetical protein
MKARAEDPVEAARIQAMMTRLHSKVSVNGRGGEDDSGSVPALRSSAIPDGAKPSPTSPAIATPGATLREDFWRTGCGPEASRPPALLTWLAPVKNRDGTSTCTTQCGRYAVLRTISEPRAYIAFYLHDGVREVLGRAESFVGASGLCEAVLAARNAG